MNIVQYPAAVVCINNEGNEVSLQLWKIYKPLRDNDARTEGFLRVVDESGEDYLFPEEYFVPIELPNEVKKPFERAVREQRRSAVASAVSGSEMRALSGTAKSRKRTGRAGRLTSR
jgi:hypothetical protein